MIDLPFDTDISSRQSHEIATALQDQAVAEETFERGVRAFQQEGVKSWAPRIILLAAHRLHRTGEFLTQYGQFLVWQDKYPKLDWHAQISDSAPADDLIAQSGYGGFGPELFPAEFERLVQSIGPPSDGPILDVGCGGGLWSLGLAQLGFQVIGTDKHAGIIEAARHNARTMGVEGNVQFFVDDACDSKLPATYNCSRVLCIAVTPCLSGDAAFDALIAYLDRVSRVPNPPQYGRQVVLSCNLWGESRVAAVSGILEADPGNLTLASYRLLMLEHNWWMQGRHAEAIKRRFPNITLIGERADPVDGAREDMLLQ
jgi:2-polyprenyl-3-methyl-5-hydroxy-6-metoxy-1,4-benzoquinol methylase